MILVAWTPVKKWSKGCFALESGDAVPGDPIRNLANCAAQPLSFGSRRIGVVEGECLLERETVLGPVALGKRLRDRLRTGMATVMAQARQRLRVALVGKDRANDAQTSHSSDIGDDVVELKIHLGQRFLHMLDVRGRVLQQNARADARRLGVRAIQRRVQAVYRGGFGILPNEDAIVRLASWSRTPKGPSSAPRYMASKTIACLRDNRAVSVLANARSGGNGRRTW